MKKIFQFVLLFAAIAVSTVPILAQAIPTDSLYLGQTPPGNTPKEFKLPPEIGLLTVERIVISPDGKEIYYTQLDNYPPKIQKIKQFIYANNKWNGPFLLFDGYNSPGISPSGDTLFFQRNMTERDYTYNAYFSVRNDSGWSASSKAFSTSFYTHYLQKTNSGNYYVSSNISGGTGGFDWCRAFITNTDTTFRSLGGFPLNSGGDNLDFFIARDESYIIIAEGGLRISFPKADGSWTNPKNLGKSINFGLNEWGPFVTLDQKYLFYTTGTKYDYSDTYVHWVSIENLIDSLKNSNFFPYLKTPIPMQTDTVGNSINYQIPDTTFIDDDGNNTLTYSATLSNGSQLPDWLKFNPSTRTFSGVPTAVTTKWIKVVATDSAKATVSYVFTLKIVAPVGIENSGEELPRSFNLEQNYPNPFNPSTTIEFAVAKSGRYKLTLYNTLGEFVKEIFNKEYDAGNYKETFEATGLSSGMYLYMLTGNNVNIVRKMVVLR